MKVKDQIEDIKRKLSNLIVSFDDGYALGHFFLWAHIKAGKRVYKVCVGSGISSRAAELIEAAQKVPGVQTAWINWD